MKGKYLPFLILPGIVFGFLLVSSLGVQGVATNGIVEVEGEWRDSGECIATVCESSLGMKEQTWYEEVCEYSCPIKYFSWQEKEYKDCPEGYNPHPHPDSNECRRTTGGPISRPYDLKEKEAYVVYNKSQDPNKCHRPDADELMDKINGYGMTLEAKNAFIALYNEWYYEEKSCEFIPTEITQFIPCDDATPFACEGEDDDEEDDNGTPPPVVVEVDDDNDGEEGETLGVAIKEEQEIEEVGVVLAATGSTSNILVYIVQSVLSLSTILSGIFFSKKYIM